MRSARRSAVLLALALSGPAARAQNDATAGTTTQIWAGLTLGKTVSQRTRLDLDLDPKWQVTNDKDWRSFNLTPRAEIYPFRWLDVGAETMFSHTRQGDDLDSAEVTPRIYARLHLFRQALQGKKRERLPLSRVAVSTLIKVEWRNMFYSDERPVRHEWRARLRLETRLALNHKTFNEDRTLYAIADAEYYAPLDDDVTERYVNKVRGRLGLGCRFSETTRLEALYVRDWNKSSADAAATRELQAFDVRLKVSF